MLVGKMPGLNIQCVTTSYYVAAENRLQRYKWVTLNEIMINLHPSSNSKQIQANIKQETASF